MRTAGHSIVLCTHSQPFGDCLITLECTCGQVLASGLFAVNDAVNQHAILREGHAKAKEHLGNAERGIRNAEPAAVAENPS